MGGIIGATSGKFVIVAAMLMLHGRIDNHRSLIAIAPGTLQSSSGPAVRTSGRLKLAIGASVLHVAAPPYGSQPDAATRLTIGRDLLDVAPIEIDFRAHEVRLLSSSAARIQERAMTAIAVSDGPDGALTVPLTIGGAAPMIATLDLASATGVSTPGAMVGAVVRLGPVALPGIVPAGGPDAKVGLLAFARSVVIFDLANHLIWVRQR